MSMGYDAGVDDEWNWLQDENERLAKRVAELEAEQNATLSQPVYLEVRELREKAAELEREREAALDREAGTSDALDDTRASASGYRADRDRLAERIAELEATLRFLEDFIITHGLHDEMVEAGKPHTQDGGGA